MNYILLVAGFALLVKCADVFIGGSVAIAERFRIPSFIIGLTIVAMGTSAPEAAVSVTAAISGQNDIATGNVIGSNIFNTLVVLGACAAIKPIHVETSMLKKDFQLNTIASAVMLLLAFNFASTALNTYTFSRLDGIIFLALFVGYLLLIILPEKNKNKETLENNAEAPIPAMSFPAALVRIVIGIAGIIIGGKLVVAAASAIAAAFGISENLIGLTIVAMGTSLPELVTSIVAALKGESDMAIGNVLGSNIFNILFVLGLSAAIHPITVNPETIFDLKLLIGISILTTILCWRGKKLNKIEGIFMLALYAAYTAYIIVR